MSVELNSRSLIYHINGLKSHLQACSPFGPRKLGPFHKRARKTRKRTTIVFLRKITRRVRRRFHEANFIVIPRLATSRLANIFGSSTIYRHDKKLKRAKNPRYKPNKPSASGEGASEVRSAKGTEHTRTGRNRAKDFTKVYAIPRKRAQYFCGHRTKETLRLVAPKFFLVLSRKVRITRES